MSTKITIHHGNEQAPSEIIITNTSFNSIPGFFVGDYNGGNTQISYESYVELAPGERNKVVCPGRVNLESLGDSATLISNLIDSEFQKVIIARVRSHKIK